MELICVILLCLLNRIVVYATLDDYKLEQIQVLFRHGDRVPDEQEIYESDPYDAIYKELGYGQLTKIGKQRQYEVGQVLRKRYGDFLGEYKSSEVYAFTTDSDRTKMSLQLVLAGLYPPTEKTSWNDHISWSPIPIHYELSYANFLRRFDCPLYLRISERTTKSSKFLKEIDVHADFIQYLKQKIGIKHENLFHPALIYSNLRAAVSLNLPLPKWCSSDDYKKLAKLHTVYFDSLFYDESQIKILAGPIIEKFLMNINENRKIFLYSGHDFNIVSLTKTHNFTNNPGPPDFGSTIIFEKLRGKDDEIYLRFSYWTGVSKDWILLKMKNCDEICPLKTYKEILKSIMPDDSSRQCDFPNAKNTEN